MFLHQFERGPLILPIRKKWGDKIATFAFVIQYTIYVTIFAIQTLPGFLLKWYSIVQVLIYTFITIKNGGDYYMLYFSQNYETNLKQLDEIGSNINFEYKRDNKSNSKQ